MEPFTSLELDLARTIARVAVANPFLPERLDAERAVLGKDYVPYQTVWSARAELPEETPNIIEIRRRAEALLAAIRGRLGSKGRLPEELRSAYEELVMYVL